MLAIPFTKHETFADRSFSVAGPKLWNKLPENIKCSSSVEDLKKQLKTYLFIRIFVIFTLSFKVAISEFGLSMFNAYLLKHYMFM